MYNEGKKEMKGQKEREKKKREREREREREKERERERERKREMLSVNFSLFSQNSLCVASQQDISKPFNSSPHSFTPFKKPIFN